jgi:thiol-disulfide isomerase/thioredoxin
VTYAGNRNKYYNIFRYVASTYEGIHFIHSFSPPVLNRRNRTVYFTKNPEKTSFYVSVPFSLSDLNELIETHNNVLKILDAPTVARIMTREDLTLLLVHTDPFHPASTQLFRTGLKLKDKALFVSTPLVEAKWMKKIVRWLGIGPQHNKPYPCLRLIARENGMMKKYEFSGTVNEENIVKLIENYKAGQLKNYYLSEDVPKEQTGSVTKVVGSNFEAVVKNKLKDVIVFFHSVWCLECKDILPVYEALAGRFSGFQDIQFISVDSYNNEGDLIPDGADGEPIMMIFRAENKKRPLKYKTKWMLGEMQSWVERSLNLKVDLDL